MIIESLQKILNEREKNYNNPMDSFQAIADLWDDYLLHKYIKRGLSVTITPLDVSQMMILMKVSRFSQNSTYSNIDCMLDVAGYAVCAEYIVDKESHI